MARIILTIYIIVSNQTFQHSVGQIDTSCSLEDYEDKTGRILVLNTSRPLCRILIEKDDLYNLTIRYNLTIKELNVIETDGRFCRNAALEFVCQLAYVYFFVLFVQISMYTYLV